MKNNEIKIRYKKIIIFIIIMVASIIFENIIKYILNALNVKEPYNLIIIIYLFILLSSINIIKYLYDKYQFSKILLSSFILTSFFIIFELIVRYLPFVPNKLDFRTSSALSIAIFVTSTVINIMESKYIKENE